MTEDLGIRPPESVDVCLVSMPYAGLQRPSLGLGLLKAILDEQDIATTVAPANLWFAEKVGLKAYELLSARVSGVHLMGEWTFAEAAFGDDPRRSAKDTAYLAEIARLRPHAPTPAGFGGEALAEALRRIRPVATEFVDAAARRILATGARIVGCTSTFEQHVASLALLRRIRELDPDVVTMMGGANCETVMGEATHRCFPWVDFVVSGEADGVIAGLCRLALDKGRDVEIGDLAPNILGPRHRPNADGAHGPGGPAAPLVPRTLPRGVFSELDDLPTPDFTDFFAALGASPLRRHIHPGVPLESSRGCWWGAVHQCTFCGLNGTGMGFRSKSPNKVLAEMRVLEDRHGIYDYEMVDNILDSRFFTTLLPELAADDPRRNLFYEIKANISRQHVKSLVEAGVRWVQPGIESLHTDVLALMDKGLKGWQNVQLLKWSRELGLRLSWAILWGFPGEKEDWYAEMAEWIPDLEHLQPPSGAHRIRFDRYSVYHEQARERNLLLFPMGAMASVYPTWPADLERLSYFFASEPSMGPYRYAESIDADSRRNPSVRRVTTAVHQWRRAFHDQQEPPALWYEDRGGLLTITDTRRCATRRHHVLMGLERAVYLATERAPRTDKIARLVGGELETSDEAVASALATLTSRRLTLSMDGRTVGLALDGEPTPLPGEMTFPGGYVSPTPLPPVETR